MAWLERLVSVLPLLEPIPVAIPEMLATQTTLALGLPQGPEWIIEPQCPLLLGPVPEVQLAVLRPSELLLDRVVPSALAAPELVQGPEAIREARAPLVPVPDLLAWAILLLLERRLVALVLDPSALLGPLLWGRLLKQQAARL